MNVILKHKWYSRLKIQGKLKVFDAYARNVHIKYHVSISIFYYTIFSRTVRK